MAWWFGVVAMVDSLSFSHFDSLSHIGCGFWFCFEFFCRFNPNRFAFFFSFFFRFDFVVGVSISNGICISSQA